MTFPWIPLLGAAAVMAVVTVLLRRATGGAPDATTPAERPAPAPADEPETAESNEEPVEFEDLLDADEGEPEQGAVLAVTSTGQVFMPMGADVRILPLGEAHAAIASGQVRWEDVRDQIIATARRGGEGGGMPGVQLDAGDFTAGRVVRGAPDVDPWRLELLGRDGEYQAHPFETPESANIALEMLQSGGIIRRPLDDDGKPVAVPDEQYAEARRAYEETLEELANMPDVEGIQETER